MFNNTHISSAIRAGKIEGIDNSILTGRSDGMVNLDEPLRRLLQDGTISRQTAQHYMSDQSLGWGMSPSRSALALFPSGGN